MLNIKKTVIAAAILSGFLLSGCSQMQVYLDEQSQALGGIIPITGKTVNAWTLKHGDVTLQKTLATQQHRLICSFLKKPVDLSLKTIDSVEVFNLQGQDSLVFHGTFGQKNLKAHEVVTFGNKTVRSMRLLKPMVFRPSADNRKLLGAPPSPNQGSSFFVATPDKQYYPLAYSQLNPADGDLYWSSVKSSQPRVATKPKAVKVPVVKRSSVKTPPKVAILAPTSDQGMPTKVSATNTVSSDEKPTLRLD